MKRFAVTTSIRADSGKIWDILTDAPRYPAWNPTVSRVEGRIAAGERLVLHTAMNTGRAFPVIVSRFEPAQRMVWTGGMPLGLFKGERTFTLSKRADGAVDFTMREEFSGLLAPLIGRTIPDLQPAFDQFAEALKREAER